MEPQLYASTNCFGSGYDSYFFTDKWGGMVQGHKRFNRACQFSCGLAAVQEPNVINGKWGFVDENIDLVIPYRYDFVGSFGSMYEDEYTWVKFDLDDDNRIDRSSVMAFGPAMIINKRGERVSKIYGFMYPSAIHSYGVALVNTGSNFASTVGNYTYATDGYWGGINGKGQEVIPAIYEFFIPMNESLFIVRKSGKWGAVNNKGKILAPTIHEGVIYEGEDGDLNTYRDIDDIAHTLPDNYEQGKYNFITFDGSLTKINL